MVGGSCTKDKAGLRALQEAMLLLLNVNSQSLETCMAHQVPEPLVLAARRRPVDEERSGFAPGNCWHRGAGSGFDTASGFDCAVEGANRQQRCAAATVAAGAAAGVIAVTTARPDATKPHVAKKRKSWQASASS
eukprot:CAMPEP_0117591892 /NCGR_PEP_ID=MMETSP0784-20121206/71793_1 /TAXON_ID=39447 /ORGANISM="" /LENGTH=133 /DNA_ID=CAMNT_0005393681 /DNA_START=143 /DNA_END=542 /DNA_ORIENTATION=+